MIDSHIITFFFLSNLVLIPLLWKLKVFSLSAQDSGGSKARIGHDCKDNGSPFQLASALIALFLYLFTVSSSLLYLEKPLRYLSFFLGFKYQVLSWVVSLSLALIALFSLLRIHAPVQQKKIIGTCSFKTFLKGVLIGCAIYPVIMSFDALVQYIVSMFCTFTPQDQVAISQLKSVGVFTSSFWLLIIAAVTVVPLVEELLFRGFLQNFFVDLLGPKIGIASTSVVFSAFHYSSTQGYSNIVLLSSIFVLSFLIGVIYHKQKSLFASFAFHATFNCLSVIFFLLLETL